MVDKKNDNDLPPEFLSQVVGESSSVKHLCTECHNFPVCFVARGTITTFENTHVGQIVVACPYFICYDDVKFLDDRDDEKPDS